MLTGKELRPSVMDKSILWILIPMAILNVKEKKRERKKPRDFHFLPYIPYSLDI